MREMRTLHASSSAETFLNIREPIPLLSAGNEGMICDVPSQLWHARPRQGYTCDEWIEWDAGRYTCESLAHDWGCACTGCKCKGKAQMTLKLFSEQKHPEARCLDGSMAGYYIRPGNEKDAWLQVTNGFLPCPESKIDLILPAKDKFLVFLEGGGWCYDQKLVCPGRSCRVSAWLQDGETEWFGKLRVSPMPQTPTRYVVGDNDTLVVASIVRDTQNSLLYDHLITEESSAQHPQLRAYNSHKVPKPEAITPIDPKERNS